ncbi:hypothetical protein U1Q18_014461 [Sarracenia purpurea var. burkii]
MDALNKAKQGRSPLNKEDLEAVIEWLAWFRSSPSVKDSSVQLSTSDIKVDPAEVKIGDTNKGVGEETAFGSFNPELVNIDDPKIERENSNTGPVSKEGNTAEVILPSIASEEV